MSETELSVGFPLDSEGFLRRACPACIREFKWLSVEGDSETPSPEHYFCPYCGRPAAPNEWFTVEQQAYIEAVVLEEVLGPSLADLRESMEQLNQSSGGLPEITASIEPPERGQAPPVFEPDNMRQVSFPCHPREPVKVYKDLKQPVYCLSCGKVSDAST